MRLLDWILLILIVALALWSAILSVSLKVLSGMVRHLYDELNGVQK